jgi:hypothetical protein
MCQVLVYVSPKETTTAALAARTMGSIAWTTFEEVPDVGTSAKW